MCGGEAAEVRLQASHHLSSWPSWPKHVSSAPRSLSNCLFLSVVSHFVPMVTNLEVEWWQLFHCRQNKQPQQQTPCMNTMRSTHTPTQMGRNMTIWYNMYVLGNRTLHMFESAMKQHERLAPSIWHVLFVSVLIHVWVVPESARTAGRRPLFSLWS